MECVGICVERVFYMTYAERPTMPYHTYHIEPYLLVYVVKTYISVCGPYQAAAFFVTHPILWLEKDIGFLRFYFNENQNPLFLRHNVYLQAARSCGRVWNNRETSDNAQQLLHRPVQGRYVQPYTCCFLQI